MNFLAKQFFEHSVERLYTAVIWGIPAKNEGTVRTRIGRSPRDRKKFQVLTTAHSGKSAITHYRVTEKLGAFAVMKLRLETGRTHQIRVHMNHLGHPLFNDAAYGGDKILRTLHLPKYDSFIENCFKLCPRQALHAQTLGFIHPSGKTLSFEAPLPKDMALLIGKIRQYINILKL